MNKSSSDPRETPPNSLVWIAGIIFAVFGGYYLWAQHKAHILQYWPLIFFALCPLMHLFGGHGCHHEDHQHNDNATEKGEHSHD